MRVVLLIFILLQSVSGYSQFFLGESRDYVKATLEKSAIKFTENKVTDTTNRISWIIQDEYQMILVLNLKDIVIKQTLIPEKENEVNKFVRLFNKDFVIISDTEWRNYADGRIYRIQLEYIGKEPLFSMTLAFKM